MEAQESIERHADAYRPGLQPILESVCDRLEEVHTTSLALSSTLLRMP